MESNSGGVGKFAPTVEQIIETLASVICTGFLQGVPESRLRISIIGIKEKQNEPFR